MNYFVISLVPQVELNGDKIGEFESQPGSVSTSLGIQQNGVDTVTLESVGIDEDEWISLLEVSACIGRGVHPSASFLDRSEVQSDVVEISVKHLGSSPPRICRHRV